MKVHLRKRALKKPKQPEDETMYDRVPRDWSLCRSGRGYVRVTDVPERVTCANCRALSTHVESEP